MKEAAPHRTVCRTWFGRGCEHVGMNTFQHTTSTMTNMVLRFQCFTHEESATPHHGSHRECDIEILPAPHILKNTKQMNHVSKYYHSVTGTSSVDTHSARREDSTGGTAPLILNPETAPGIHSTGGSVGLGASLGILAKRKTLASDVSRTYIPPSSSP
jgi:hypothetical protein